MKTLTLTEHARFIRGAVDNFKSYPPVLCAASFDALRHRDEHLADTYSRQIFDWRASSAKARHWVGVMQSGDLCVEILPKVGKDHVSQRHNVLAMLKLAGQTPQRIRERAGQSLSGANLLELLIEGFVTELLGLLGRGLQQYYVEQDENCKMLRGKLLFSEHIKHNSARQDRFFVRHDEMSSDHVLNQILNETCKTLLGSVRGVALRKKLVQCLDYFQHVRPLALRTHHFDRLVLTRQTAHWGPSLEFCRLVYHGLAPDMHAGPRRYLTLLFDMNALFEGYVTALCQRMIQTHEGMGDYTCVPQGKGQRMYLLCEGGGERKTRQHLHLKPDIMLTHPDRPPIVMDTKWKILRKEGSRRQHVSREDLYQMFGYAHRFQSVRNILLYPRPEGVEMCWRQNFEIPHTGSEENARIEVHTIDLSEDIRDLRSVVMQLVQCIGV